MPPSSSPFAAIAATPPAEFGRELPEPRGRFAARRFMSSIDVGLTALLVLFGATVASSLVIFLGSLAITVLIEAGRWALAAGSEPAVHVLSLVEFSAVGGLLLAAMGCAVFASDLRRQRWF